VLQVCDESLKVLDRRAPSMTQVAGRFNGHRSTSMISGTVFGFAGRT